MDLAALSLVLASAFLHSGWNGMAMRYLGRGAVLWPGVLGGLFAYHSGDRHFAAIAEIGPAAGG